MGYYLKISLVSDICMGNGESKGNAVDRDICTTKEGIPYIPARRIKGCLRQTAEFLKEKGYPVATEKTIKELFGDKYDFDGNIVIDDANISNMPELKAAIENLLKEPSKEYLRHIVIPENMKRIYTSVRGQTSLKDGVKVDNSLRFTRVLMKHNMVFNENEPVSFMAPVYLNNEDDKQLELLKSCCKGTRHLGTGRNRGLGNVSISLCEADSQKQEVKIPDFKPVEDCFYEMKYMICLDSSVCVPAIDDVGTVIPARSIIGCLGGYYVKKYKGADDTFKHLFLDGSVKWSSLTPVIDDQISSAVPTMLVKLKNDPGRMINIFSQTDEEWKKLKPKTMDGYFACQKRTDGILTGYKIASVKTHAQYHNNLTEQTLYMQDSINEGYIYGGTVIFEGKHYNKIIELLREASFRFGRSRNVQYSNCKLIELEEPVECTINKSQKKVNPGDCLYVILKSDLIFNKEGIYLTDSNEIRNEIAQTLELSDCESNSDNIKYGVIGGYNNMWQMQKTRIPAVKAGSVFCFKAKNQAVLSDVILGEFQQEGFGRCEIITESEIKKIKDIENDSVKRQPYSDDLKTTKTVEIKLTELMVRELLLKYANDYKESEQTDKKGDKAELPIGRLRLMLSESLDYNMFISKIKTMKTSDVSSKSEGKRKRSLDFVYDFYGENTIDWKKLFKQSPQLYEAITKDSDTLVRIEKKYWKLPMETKLHELHYGKEAK